MDFREFIQRDSRLGGYFNKPIPLGETGYKLSIQAGEYHYSQPKEHRANIYDYTHLEVGLFTPNGRLVGGGSGGEGPDWWPAKGNVWGYASVDDINTLIEQVLAGAERVGQ